MPGQSERECERCTATAKSGNRCRNRTCRGTVCWQHLKRDSGLRVKQSQIAAAGMGLWTTRRFKPNEKIGKYFKYTGDLANFLGKRGGKPIKLK